MTLKPHLIESEPAEADFIDEIAELLPAGQRQLWYRDMAHLRRLPADDEMLRIARAMGFLALVTRQTPAQIAAERERLAAILSDSIKAIQSARRDALVLQQQLEDRLTQLPDSIAEGISPAAIAAKLSESLRQQFVASGIPETAQTLAVVSKQTRQVAVEFDHTSKQLTDSYRGAAGEARRALDEMRASIEYATATAKQAAHDLTHTFLREYKWSVFALCTLALALGFALGTLFYRWINSTPNTPESSPNTAVVPVLPSEPLPSTTAPRPNHKHQDKT
ncbi:MAG: hypothetical protein WB714_06330, partial [Candidatus Sulfotelmatobacter sp.]